MSNVTRKAETERAVAFGIGILALTLVVILLLLAAEPSRIQARMERAIPADSGRLGIPGKRTQTIAADEPAPEYQLGSWTQTTQQDFQTGERWGVDTYGAPGSVTLLPLDDDFDAENMNLDRWVVYGETPEIVSYTSGLVEIASKDKGIRSAAGIGMRGTFLQGDFDYQVDFDLLEWSSTVEHCSADLEAADRMPERDPLTHWVMLKLDSDEYEMHYGTGSTWHLLFRTRTGDRTGKFRINRTGQTFTTYYWHETTGWTAMGSKDYFDDPACASVAGWNTIYYPRFLIHFDNFLVTRNGGIEDPTYAFTGTYTSPAFDTSGPSYLGTLAWSPHSQPLETGVDSLKVQVATNNDNATWHFVGPDGTPNTYYTQSGQEIWDGHHGDRYVRYRIYFATLDPMFTPRVDDITLNFVPADAFYLERLPFTATFETHQNLISSYFDHNYPSEGLTIPQPPDFDIPIYTGEIALQSLGTCCPNLPCYRSIGQRCIAYDGHNGYDYGLTPGTPIYPAAPGTIVDISDAGSYPWLVVVEHQSVDATYVTWYAHIEPDAAVYQEWLGSSSNPEERKLPVETSRTIGTVKSGVGYEHLHFTVKRDGRYTDPYGWLPPVPDPLHAHNGEISRWLWIRNEPRMTLYEPSQETRLTTQIQDVSVTVPAGAYLQPLLLQLYHSALDPVPMLTNGGHTFSLTGWDSQGKPVADLNLPFSVTVRYLDGDIGKAEDTLALYQWDTAQGFWQIVPSELNPVANVLTAQTATLGRFALLGEVWCISLPLVAKP